jgi:ATP-dependent DNA helicase RecQ
MTAQGLDMLKQRKRVTLTKPVSAPERKERRIGDIACDEILFERLRQLRKRLADERAVPPYIVFSDVSLRQMARDYPSDEREFTRISGVGEKKLREFGSLFLSQISEHLRSNPRQMFAEDSFRAPTRVPPHSHLSETARDTLRRFQSGQPPETIAAQRSLSVGTVYGHLANAIAVGEKIDLSRFLTAAEVAEIKSAFAKGGVGALSPVFEILGGRYDYDRLRLVRAALARDGVSPQVQSL